MFGIDKKGELTSQQIVIMVLAIGGFILVAIALVVVLTEDELQQRELCHLSIVERATVPGVLEQSVPLQCFTGKICVTTDKKNKCKQFAGESNIRYVEIGIPKIGEKNIFGIESNKKVLEKYEEAVKTIEMETANAMFDCYTMTGEGKLDIFTNSGSIIADLTKEVTDISLSEIKPKCIICSRIAFSDALFEADEKFKKDLDENNKIESGVQGSPLPITDSVLGKVDVNSYMAQNTIPGKTITYLQAYTDEGVGGFGELSINESKARQEGSVEKPKGYPQLAMIFMQIKVGTEDPNDVYWKTFKAGAIVGGAAMISGPGKIISLLTPGPGWLKAVGKLVGIGVVSNSLASKAESVVEKNQAVSAANCGEFESTVYNTEDGKKVAVNRGCSLTKIMEWNVDTINDICIGGIEGNL
jgi:hypothetical protein